jgi:hypothetical protein
VQRKALLWFFILRIFASFAAEKYSSSAVKTSLRVLVSEQ